MAAGIQKRTTVSERASCCNTSLSKLKLLPPPSLQSADRFQLVTRLHSLLHHYFAVLTLYSLLAMRVIVLLLLVAVLLGFVTLSQVAASGNVTADSNCYICTCALGCEEQTTPGAKCSSDNTYTLKVTSSAACTDTSVCPQACNSDCVSTNLGAACCVEGSACLASCGSGKPCS